MTTTSMSINAPEKRATRIIRIAELSEILGLSRSTIYNKLKRNSRYFDESFPQPVKLGLAAVGWLEVEAQDWILQRRKINQ